MKTQNHRHYDMPFLAILGLTTSTSSHFWNESYWGYQLIDWAVSFLIVLGCVILGKVLYWFFKNVLKKLTAKTKSKLDDIIVDMIEEPIVFALVLGGIWYGVEHQLGLTGAARTWVDRVFYILITFNIAWMISRLFKAIIQEYVAPMVEQSEGDLDDQLLPIVQKGVNIVIWLVAIIVGIDNAGYDVSAILAGLGIGGLALALAAKDSVSHLIGGFTIFADKPFRIHDRIQVDGYDGIVSEIGLRSTRIRTLEGRIVTIPNADIANNSVENISSEPTRKVVLNLGLTYDMDHNDMQKGMDLLTSIGEAHQDIIEETTLVSFNAFGDFALNILFIYYIKPESDILATMTTMNMDILKTFNENKLDFAFPSQTIYQK